MIAAVADLGYADCTATAWRPSYLPAGAARRRSTSRPGSASTTAGGCSSCRRRTRSERRLARSAALPPVVHVHFHDYELLDPKRRLALQLTLAVLARRRRPTELGALRADREVEWADVCVG